MNKISLYTVIFSNYIIKNDNNNDKDQNQVNFVITSKLQLVIFPALKVGHNWLSQNLL